MADTSTLESDLSQPTLEEALARNPALGAAVCPRWNSYIPHDPTVKQAVFLSIGHLEAFYGGAAGGGKSDALLAGALQYVDIPGYASIIFRKTFTDLALPEALIARSHEWLHDTDAKWNNQLHQWRFPSSATLSFGYLDTETDKYRYQSAAFQFIGLDELTQHYESNYLYMFSRLRRPAVPCINCRTPLELLPYEDELLNRNGSPKLDAQGNPLYRWVEGWMHQNLVPCDNPVPDPKTLKKQSALYRVPLRMRAASNPGGLGHRWVRDRFQIEEVLDTRTGRSIFRGTHPDRAYIPAFLSDNPYLDQKGYTKNLELLDPVTREQLLRGDWGVTHNGRFRRSWARRYYLKGDYFCLNQNGAGEPLVHRSKCRVFQTIDPAASVKEGPGDEQIYLKKMPSASVISTWIVTPSYDLIWWDCDRFQLEIPEVLGRIRASFEGHLRLGMQPEFVGIEGNGTGIGVYQSAARMGLPVRDLRPRSLDKLVRSTDAANRMESGKVYFPADGIGGSLSRKKWLPGLEAELYTWTGHPHEQADQIDTLSYAAMLVSQDAVGFERVLTQSDVPFVLRIPM